MRYAILISKSVRKQLDKLSNNIRLRALAKIRLLAEVPRPDGVKKLKGYSSQYRLRVGSYRIRYDIDDEQRIIKILQCKHRRDVYKDKD